MCLTLVGLGGEEKENFIRYFLYLVELQHDEVVGVFFLLSLKQGKEYLLIFQLDSR